MEDTRRPVLDGRVIRVSIDTVTLPNGHRTDLEIVHHPGGAGGTRYDDVLARRQRQRTQKASEAVAAKITAKLGRHPVGATVGGKLNRCHAVIAAKGHAPHRGKPALRQLGAIGDVGDDGARAHGGDRHTRAGGRTRHGIGERIFEAVKQTLKDQGALLQEGTILDATIIHAPSSTSTRA